MAIPSQTKPSQSGVFQGGTDARLEAFSESVSFDARLLKQDIQGSSAHARMLGRVGLITPDEADRICRELLRIEDDIVSGRVQLRRDFEDIHMNVESLLTDALGDTGRRLHTGRSRNDQVATDFRLWIRQAIDELDMLLRDLQRAFHNRCEADFEVILPAYTHLRRAQPVLAPHYWLCYVEKFDRDRQRLRDCRKRLNHSPLGSAAVAGTTLPIDRNDTADALGFEGVLANSLDVSSDRDFALEFVFCLTTIALHLSTLAEEWILWSTAEFGFLNLPESFCTGSSIMPQKINPDTLELIRGKTGRVAGSLNTLIVLVKGLPLAYNRDLQEDKPPVFDAFDTVRACVEIVTPIVAGATLRKEAIAETLEHGHLDATTLMEHLIRQGLPQRTAHDVVGRLVREGMRRGVSLSQLPDEVVAEILPKSDDAAQQGKFSAVPLTAVLGVKNAIAAFRSYGSTAPAEVRHQIEAWAERLAESPQLPQARDSSQT